MSDRLARLTAAMADALGEVAPTDEAEWRKVRVVTVELELTADGAVTCARGWLEKRVGPKALGPTGEHQGRRLRRRPTPPCPRPSASETLLYGGPPSNPTGLPHSGPKAVQDGTVLYGSAGPLRMPRRSR